MFADTFAGMDISGEKTAGRMTHLEAWAHFYTRWQRLTGREHKAVPKQTRHRIGLAQQDFQGIRKSKKGVVLRLGPKRVADILLAVTEAMPETFAYIYHPPVEEWFEVGE